jgi:lysozyme
MTRQLDQASIEALKLREGCRLIAYQDQGCTWTIGWGETDGVHEGMTITQAQADEWFARELVPFEECVASSVKVALTDNQFGALVSFAYNVGIAAFESSTLLRKLNAGGYESVPAEMLRWTKVHGVVDPGLVNRRNSEGGQWVKGAFVRGAVITPDAPPPWWRTGATGKAVGAVSGAAASAYTHISSDSLQKAADTAQAASQHWHMFGTVAAIISGALVLWLLMEKKA